jgi:cobalamin biosynthesis protein CobD/CbiB
MRGDDYVDDEPEGREEGLMMMELEQPADDDEVLGQYYVARREMLAQTLQRRKKWIVGGAATCLVVVLLLGIVAMAVRNQGEHPSSFCLITFILYLSIKCYFLSNNII